MRNRFLELGDERRPGALGLAVAHLEPKPLSGSLEMPLWEASAPTWAPGHLPVVQQPRCRPR